MIATYTTRGFVVALTSALGLFSLLFASACREPEVEEPACFATFMQINIDHEPDLCDACGFGTLSWTIYKNPYEDPQSPPADGFLASFANRVDLSQQGAFFSWTDHPCGDFSAHVEYLMPDDTIHYSEVISYTVTDGEVNDTLVGHLTGFPDLTE